MDETTKNNWKAFGIWYGVFIILLALAMLCFTHINECPFIDIFEHTLLIIMTPAIILFVVIIIFLPVLLVLYCIFKKIKNITVRTILTALLIPFTNMIYYFIEYFAGDTFGILSMIIGLFATILVLPFTFIATLFIPKSLFPFKKQVLLGTMLMFIIGWILMFISWETTYQIDSFKTNKKLQKYDPIIMQIETYKSKNGYYPETIDNNIQSIEFKYKPKEGNKGFIINVTEDWISYYYCSKPKYDECKEGWHDGAEYTKVGKWVRVDYND